MAEKTELPASRTVDPEDEPSAKWGWHGTFPMATQVAGWFAAIVCFLMLTATHTSKTEWVFLVATGVIIIALLLNSLRRKRSAWRR